MKTPFSTVPVEPRRGVASHPLPLTPVADRRVATRDRRIEPRMKTLKGGRMLWPSGTSTDCVVRDVSETGARIDVSSAILQDTFDLVFDDANWSCRPCTIVWRSPGQIGVRFQATDLSDA